MNERAEGRLLPARWLIVVIALLLAWLCVRNAAQHLFATSEPALAAKFWPADGASLAALAQDRVTDAGGTVDQTSARLARDALRKSPRAATPLVIAGFAASAAGDLGRAQALMEAARARQPRTETARFWLLDHYMRTGQYAAGLDEIQPAIALRGSSGGALMDLVGALAAVPAAHHALVAKLEAQPAWRVGFFQSEANAALPPRTMLSLLESLPPNSDPDAARAEQRAVLGSLIARGDYAGAYGVWLSFQQRSNRPAAGTIYDPDFVGLAGAEPFNWSLQPTSDVTVTRAKLPELAEGSALAIDFRGTVPGAIANETVPVSAGAYTLSLKGRRVGEPIANGRIVVTLTCMSDNHVLATLPVDPLSASLRLFQTDLVVPPTCPFATLAISGEPGDTFGVVSAQITAFSLTKR